jgi:hypothetical protein
MEGGWCARRSGQPEPSSRCPVSLSQALRVRTFLEDTLADLKLAPPKRAEPVRHAYADEEGHTDIVELLDDRLIVEVADDGSGFEPGTGRRTATRSLEGGLDRDHPLIADEVEIGGGPEAAVHASGS